MMRKEIWSHSSGHNTRRRTQPLGSSTRYHFLNKTSSLVTLTRRAILLSSHLPGNLSPRIQMSFGLASPQAKHSNSRIRIMTMAQQSHQSPLTISLKLKDIPPPSSFTSQVSWQNSWKWNHSPSTQTEWMRQSTILRPRHLLLRQWNTHSQKIKK